MGHICSSFVKRFPLMPIEWLLGHVVVAFIDEP